MSAASSPQRQSLDSRRAARLQLLQQSQSLLNQLSKSNNGEEVSINLSSKLSDPVVASNTSRFSRNQSPNKSNVKIVTSSHPPAPSSLLSSSIVIERGGGLKVSSWRQWLDAIEKSDGLLPDASLSQSLSKSKYERLRPSDDPSSLSRDYQQGLINQSKQLLSQSRQVQSGLRLSSRTPTDGDTLSLIHLTSTSPPSAISHPPSQPMSYTAIIDQDIGLVTTTYPSRERDIQPVNATLHQNTSLNSLPTAYNPSSTTAMKHSPSTNNNNISSVITNPTSSTSNNTSSSAPTNPSLTYMPSIHSLQETIYQKNRELASAKADIDVLKLQLTSSNHSTNMSSLSNISREESNPMADLLILNDQLMAQLSSQSTLQSKVDSLEQERHELSQQIIAITRMSDDWRDKVTLANQEIQSLNRIINSQNRAIHDHADATSSLNATISTMQEENQVLLVSIAQLNNENIKLRNDILTAIDDSMIQVNASQKVREVTKQNHALQHEVYVVENEIKQKNIIINNFVEVLETLTTDQEKVERAARVYQQWLDGDVRVELGAMKNAISQQGKLCTAMDDQVRICNEKLIKSNVLLIEHMERYNPLNNYFNELSAINDHYQSTVVHQLNALTGLQDKVQSFTDVNRRLEDEVRRQNEAMEAQQRVSATLNNSNVELKQSISALKREETEHKITVKKLQSEIETLNDINANNKMIISDYKQKYEDQLLSFDDLNNEYAKLMLSQEEMHVTNVNLSQQLTIMKVKSATVVEPAETNIGNEIAVSSRNANTPIIQQDVESDIQHELKVAKLALMEQSSTIDLLRQDMEEYRMLKFEMTAMLERLQALTFYKKKCDRIIHDQKSQANELEEKAGWLQHQLHQYQNFIATVENDVHTIIYNNNNNNNKVLNDYYYPLKEVEDALSTTCTRQVTIINKKMMNSLSSLQVIANTNNNQCHRLEKLFSLVKASARLYISSVSNEFASTKSSQDLINSLNSENSNLKNENLKIKKQNKSLEESIANDAGVMIELVDARNKIREYEMRLQEANVKMMDDERMMRNMEEMIEGLQRELVRLEVMMPSLRSSIDDSIYPNSLPISQPTVDYHQKIAAYENDINLKSKQIREYQRINDEKTTQIQSLKEKIESLKLSMESCKIPPLIEHMPTSPLQSSDMGIEVTSPLHQYKDVMAHVRTRVSQARRRVDHQRAMDCLILLTKYGPLRTSFVIWYERSCAWKQRRSRDQQNAGVAEKGLDVVVADVMMTTVVEQLVDELGQLRRRISVLARKYMSLVIIGILSWRRSVLMNGWKYWRFVVSQWRNERQFRAPNITAMIAAVPTMETQPRRRSGGQPGFAGNFFTASG